MLYCENKKTRNQKITYRKQYSAKAIILFDMLACQILLVSSDSTFINRSIGSIGSYQTKSLSFDKEERRAMNTRHVFVNVAHLGE